MKEKVRSSASNGTNLSEESGDECVSFSTVVNSLYFHYLYKIIVISCLDQIFITRMKHPVLEVPQQLTTHPEVPHQPTEVAKEREVKNGLATL